MAVLALLFTGFWPAIGAYLIAALIMKPAPVIPIYDRDEQEFYDSYTQSRQGAAHRLKKRYQSLERRIRRMEDRVTGREFDWERRFNDH
jgi:phage shock protein C